MTLEVDTPNGGRRGSGVYQVSAQKRAALAPTGEAREWHVAGEAVAVDLPGGKCLFALLRTAAIHNDLAGMSMSTLDPAFRNDMIECAQRIANKEGIRSPATVPITEYPLLVTFEDVAVPASVEVIKPAEMSTSFGSGVRLTSIKVEVTDDALTTGLRQRLPWLKKGSPHVATGPRLIANPDPYDHSSVATLAFGDFLAEE